MLSRQHCSALWKNASLILRRKLSSKRKKLSLTKIKKPSSFNYVLNNVENMQQIFDFKMKDFESQYYRKTVHSIFSCCVSRFYSELPRKIIYDEISTFLSLPAISLAIKNARFRGTKARIMHFALKHKFFYLLYLYSKK